MKKSLHKTLDTISPLHRIEFSIELHKRGQNLLFHQNLQGTDLRPLSSYYIIMKSRQG